MSIFYSLAKVAVVFVCVFIFASSSPAAVTIEVSEVEGSVVFSYSGSLDLTGVPKAPPFKSNGFAGVWGKNKLFALRPPKETIMLSYEVISAPETLGTGNVQPTSIGAGDVFEVGETTLRVAESYVSNEPINGSITYTNESLASLGIDLSLPRVWVLWRGETVTMVKVVP